MTLRLFQNGLAWYITLCLLGAPAAALEWDLLAHESELSFHGTMLGVPVIGVFEQVQADIRFDPENLADARIAVRIDMTSINTRHDERDTALRRPEWFNAGAFSQARFVAEDLRQIDELNYEARGELTIKGISQPVTLPFSLAINGDIATVTGIVDLSRREFAIGTGEWADDKRVAFDVRIHVRITAKVIHRKPDE
jgi:polyisoprenoid-binding protein YceI